MPFRCCVPNCKGNYPTGPKVHVFKFPADVELRKKWTHAVKREKFTPSATSRVCHLHFSTADVVWQTSMTDVATGVVLTAPLRKPRLAPGASPTILPNCPSYLSKNVEAREGPDEKKARKENDAMERAIAESLSEANSRCEERSVCSFLDLKHKVSMLSLEENWSYVVREKCVIIMYLDLMKEPHNIVYILVDMGLNLKVYIRGVEVTIQNVQYVQLSSVDKLQEFVDSINVHVISSGTSDDKNSLLLSLINELQVPEEKVHCADFIKKQAQFCCISKHSVRYDCDTLIFASLVYFISPHAYNFLRSCGNIILPHANTIKNLCSTFNVNPACEQQPSQFLHYVKQRVCSLKPFERLVSLMIDEIHIQPFIDYKGGSLVGMAHDSTKIASTAHVFMIQSVLSAYKDVVHILPVNTLKAESLFVMVKNVVVGLHRIGFSVACIVTDNNSINRKSISLFSDPPLCKILYTHPCESQPLFHLIDTVHIFKCVRNNWLQQKNDGMSFIFPDFHNPGNKCTASFHTLRLLYNAEKEKLVKVGYGLSAKALWPSTLERQNVKLVCEIFNEHVINALVTLGPTHSLPHYQGTADFLRVILTWWYVVNVKTPLKGIHLRNDYQKPVTHISDERMMFLKKFSCWLDHWEGMNLPTGKLTKETHYALKNTTSGLIQLSHHFLTVEPKLSYVLLGKFQTDALEARFGKYRQLAGAQYHVSLRQVYEVEKKLRLSSMLELSFSPTNKVRIQQLDVSDENVDSDDGHFPTFTDIDVLQDIDSIFSDLPVLTYIAGYCCYSFLKKNNCAVCKDILIMDREIICDHNTSLIVNLDRGALKYPQENSTLCVVYCFIVLSKHLLANSEFLKLGNQRKVASEFILKLFLNDVPVSSSCSAHTSTSLYSHIIWTTVNILLNNYCKVRNATTSKNRVRKLKTLGAV